MSSCSKCGKLYPRTNEYFRHRSQSKDGLAYQCKTCQRLNDVKVYEERKHGGAWHKKMRGEYAVHECSAPGCKNKTTRRFLCDWHYLYGTDYGLGNEYSGNYCMPCV